MSRFKEARRIEDALKSKVPTELRWALNYCRQRLELAELKQHQTHWRALLDQVQEALDGAAEVACLRCADLRLQYEIHSPGQLQKAIRVARQNVADGTLEVLAEEGAFSGLDEEGPWPDHINLTFRCPTCDSRFSLSAETYHGAGGRWALLSRPGAG